MFQSLTLATLLMVAITSRAAAGGINLSWNDCGVFGAPNAGFACNTNSGAQPCCSCVPTLPRTWGQVKSLSR